MDLFTHHHLYYLWEVARAGRVAPVSARLGVAQSSIEEQIHTLEEEIGQPLFTLIGDRWILTERGQGMYNYADEIFGFFV